MEPGEDARATAEREAAEEADLRGLELRWLSAAGARERLSERLVPILDWAHDLVARESKRSLQG